MRNAKCYGKNLLKSSKFFFFLVFSVHGGNENSNQVFQQQKFCSAASSSPLLFTRQYKFSLYNKNNHLYSLAASNNTVREWSKTWCFWRRIWIISAAEQSAEDPWALSEIAKQHTRNVSDPWQFNWETFWFWEKMPYLNILRGTLLPHFWDSNCCSCFLRAGCRDKSFVCWLGLRSKGDILKP